MKITIKNDFHNTECSIIVGANGHANVRQLARVKRVLCGQSDCHCGWNAVIGPGGRPMETGYNEDLSINFTFTT